MSFGSVDKTIKKVKSDLKEAVKNNDVEKIFNYFGIENRKDADGFFTLSYYMQPEIGDKQYKFSSFGIDENKLVEKIKCIEEYGDFGNAQNLEFCNLETALNVDLRNSKDIDLKNLEKVDGNILSLNAKNIKLDKWFVKSRFQVVYGS